MTSEQLPPSRRFRVALPRHSGLMVGGAFVLGLLGFVLVQSLDRDKAFYRGQPNEVADPSSVPLAPLPTPLAAGGNSQLPELPRAEGGERPHLVEAEPAPVHEPAPLAGVAPDAAPAETVAAEPSAPLVDAPPQRIAEQSPAPEYPATALRRGRSGTVVLSVQVDATGRPARVRIAQRSGTRELDRAALEAVQRWRFRPAMSNGQPVPGQVEVPIEFSP